MPKKPSENPPWIVWSRARAGGPSFPRKRESSGERRHTRADIWSFQTVSKISLRIFTTGASALWLFIECTSVHAQTTNEFRTRSNQDRCEHPAPLGGLGLSRRHA